MRQLREVYSGCVFSRSFNLVQTYVQFSNKPNMSITDKNKNVAQYALQDSKTLI